jgi:hypothetical protein
MMPTRYRNTEYRLVAVVAETVVGATTGVMPAPKGYFKAMKSMCEKYGALFILDKVGLCFVFIMGVCIKRTHARLCAEWAVGNVGIISDADLDGNTGMGTTHAWESFGDGVAVRCSCFFPRAL